MSEAEKREIVQTDLSTHRRQELQRLKLVEEELSAYEGYES